MPLERSVFIVGVHGAWPEIELPYLRTLKAELAPLSAQVAVALGLTVGLEIYEHPPHQIQALCCGGAFEDGSFPSPKPVIHQHWKEWHVEPDDCPHEECQQHGEWRDLRSFQSWAGIGPYITEYLGHASMTGDKQCPVSVRANRKPHEGALFVGACGRDLPEAMCHLLLEMRRLDVPVAVL